MRLLSREMGMLHEGDHCARQVSTNVASPRKADSSDCCPMLQAILRAGQHKQIPYLYYEATA